MKLQLLKPHHSIKSLRIKLFLTALLLTNTSYLKADDTKTKPGTSRPNASAPVTRPSVPPVQQPIRNTPPPTFTPRNTAPQQSAPPVSRPAVTPQPRPQPTAPVTRPNVSPRPNPSPSTNVAKPAPRPNPTPTVSKPTPRPNPTTPQASVAKPVPRPNPTSQTTVAKPVPRPNPTPSTTATKPVPKPVPRPNPTPSTTVAKPVPKPNPTPSTTATKPVPKPVPRPNTNPSTTVAKPVPKPVPNNSTTSNTTTKPIPRPVPRPLTTTNRPVPTPKLDSNKTTAVNTNTGPLKRPVPSSKVNTKAKTIAELKPDQKKKLDALKTDVKKNQPSKKPDATAKNKPKPSSLLSHDKLKDQYDPKKLSKLDSITEAAKKRLEHKNPSSVLTKSDTKDIKKDLFDKHGASMGLTDTNVKKLDQLFKDPKTTPAERAAIKQALLDPANLTAAQKQVLAKKIDSTTDPTTRASLIKAIRESNELKSNQQALNGIKDQLGNLTPNNFLGNNLLASQLIFEGGALLNGLGGSLLPPFVPTAFIPTEPLPLGFDPGVMAYPPQTSGIALGFLPAPIPENYPIQEVVGEATGAEVIPDANDVPAGIIPDALQQTQTTRFLSFGNKTDEEVTLNLEYTSTDENGNHVSNKGATIVVKIAPGETKQIEDPSGWTVNCTKANFWAQTASGSKKWDVFKDKDLNVVPEGSYESDGVQSMALVLQ